MTPPLPEPLLPDADPSGTARAALKALFQKVRRESLCRHELSIVERADSLFECKALWEGLYGPSWRGWGKRERPSFERAAPQWVGDTSVWIYYLLGLRKLLSPDERAALKGSPIKRSETDLRSVASIRDAGKRAALISALSDAENPAPSLRVALQRAGLHRCVSADQTHRQARSRARDWRKVNPDALKKFASWMSARRPGFAPSIFTAVDVYLVAESQSRRAEKVRFMDVREKTGIRSQHLHGCGRLSWERGTGVMTKSLPEPLLLNGKPHYTYTALQIAGMRLPGMPGTRHRGQRQDTLGVLALPPPPLGSRRREGVSAQSPAGRGAGKNPPTRTARTHATRSCGLSLHSGETEPQKAPLSRPWTGSKRNGRCEGRGGRPVEAIQAEPPQGDTHPRRPQGFLRTVGRHAIG